MTTEDRVTALEAEMEALKGIILTLIETMMGEKK